MHLVCLELVHRCYDTGNNYIYLFSASALLDARQEGHLACKNLTAAKGYLRQDFLNWPNLWRRQKIIVRLNNSRV